MPKVKLTKTELKAQKDALARYRRFLPMLQLKKSQLQAELGGMRAKEEELARRERIAHEAAALADRIDGMILPRMRRCWRWRQLYLRAKIDEAIYSARDARTPAALTAYGELTNLYHAEKQVERLYDGTWRGYTCPPFADHE